MARPDPNADRRRRLRLFVAGELPPATLLALREWQRRELSGRRELRINQALHMTLAFLGDTDAARVPELSQALASVAWAACPARLGEPLFLPPRGARRVLALALEDTDGCLRALQAAVSAALAATGVYAPERRQWTPHVTVARFRAPGQPFLLQNVTIPAFCVVRMGLYSSSLESTGAVHTPITLVSAS